MSSVSLLSPLPSVEPSTVRRRGSDATSDRQAEVFTLPEPPRDAPERPVAARDDRPASRPASETRAAGGEDRAQDSRVQDGRDAKAQDTKTQDDKGQDDAARDQGARGSDDQSKAAADKADPRRDASKSDDASARTVSDDGKGPAKAGVATTAVVTAQASAEVPVDAAALFILAVTGQAGTAASVGAGPEEAAKDDATEEKAGETDAETPVSAPLPVIATAVAQPATPLLALLGQPPLAAKAESRTAAVGQAQGAVSGPAGPQSILLTQAAALGVAAGEAGLKTTDKGVAEDKATDAAAEGKAGKGAELSADASAGLFAKEAGGEKAVAPAVPAAQAAEMLQAATQAAPTAADLSALLAGGAERHDGVKGVGGAIASHAAAAPNTSGSAAATPMTPPHLVPMEIGLRALSGSKRFDIRLDPAELGRIDVSLNISDKGEVSARLVVDRVETLHMMQRDARTLERAFEQAGLKPSDGGVEITLRDPSDQSGFRQNHRDEDTPRRARGNGGGTDEVSAIVAQPVSNRRLVRLGGVDLSI